MPGGARSARRAVRGSWPGLPPLERALGRGGAAALGRGCGPWGLCWKLLASRKRPLMAAVRRGEAPSGLMIPDEG